MKTNLRKEIEGKFNLNEIQKQAIEKVGKNLIIDAPTASGKTEAILLSILEGSTVTWMLPTITSCIFMYRRLCHDFNGLNVRVLTSTLEDERILDDRFTTINIITCDPYMVSYMRSFVEEGVSKQTTDSVLVLDEIDNYPVKVRTALKHYISNIELDQIILASATLDEELKTIKKDFEMIKFSHISNKIRYKSLVIDRYDKVAKIVKDNYKKKKIGIICNCITYMEYIASGLQDKLGLHCEEDMNIIFHHSGLPNEIKLENERRLFEKDYDLLVSNDLISMSVDVDLDILIMDWSDKLNVNIQRMGRLNRRGKKANFTNLFIVSDGMYPPFIDRDDAEDLLDNLGFEVDESKLITSDMISNWSNQIILDEYSFNDLINDVKFAIENNEEILLRDVPMTFRYKEVITVQTRKKGKKITAERKVVTTDKKMNHIPYVWETPRSEECGEKDLLYMPWLGDVEHPDFESSNIWLIESYDSNSGIRTIVPYDGQQFEYYDDDELDKEVGEVETADNIIEDEAWEEYECNEDGPSGEKLEYFNVGPVMYSFRQDRLDEDVYRNNSIKLAFNLLNKLLHEAKSFKFKYLDKLTMDDIGTNIVNSYFSNEDYNPYMVLKVLGNMLYLNDSSNYDLSIFKSSRAALKISEHEDCKFLEFNLRWLALHPGLKEIFIKEFEPIIRREIGDVDHSKIIIKYEEDPETEEQTPLRFVYENLSYDIPALFVQDVWLGAEVHEDEY